jgi:hypothetical protein
MNLQPAIQPTSCQKVAATLSVMQLMHATKTLNAEVIAAMESGRVGTVSDLGKIEMATACASELYSRGRITNDLSPRFGGMRDGSDMPRDIAWIFEYGIEQKLSNSIRCF